MTNDPKSRIIKLMQDAEEEPIKNNITVSGQGNIVSGGNITIDNKNIQIEQPARTIIQKKFTPGPEHISAEQAKILKDMIDNLVQKETAAGNQSSWAYSHWWGRLKKDIKSLHTKKSRLT